MKLTMLGTGNALVTECYNTCFLLEDNGQLFMVDGGGGNTVLHQIRHAGYDWMDIRHIFVTHKHIDHLLGIFWMVRMICQFMDHGEYRGDAYIYSHGEVLALIRDMAGRLLREKEAAFIDDRLHLVEVTDRETREIIGHETTFFDIHSTKAKQFGFRMDIGNGEALTCCGDEPLVPAVERYALGSKWMLHEAFCLYSQAGEAPLHGEGRLRAGRAPRREEPAAVPHGRSESFKPERALFAGRNAVLPRFTVDSGRPGKNRYLTDNRLKQSCQRRVNDNMETKYYIVARIDGDYAWLKRTDAEEGPLFIARALLPEEIDEGTRLKY